MLNHPDYTDPIPRTNRLRERNASERPVRRVIQYESGLVFGLLTLDEPDWQEAYDGRQVSRGYWLANCACGTTGYKVHTTDLRKVTAKGYSCGCTPLPAIPPESIRTRPPADHAGKTFGRLVAVEWKPRQGWECVCVECSEYVTVRISSQLGPAGMKPCGKPCQQRQS